MRHREGNMEYKSAEDFRRAAEKWIASYQEQRTGKTKATGR